MNYRYLRLASTIVACLAFTGLCALAQSPQPLSDKLARGAQIQQQINQLFLEISSLKLSVCEGFQPYLPGPETHYGQLEWDCHYTDGTLRYSVRDAHGKSIASVQILYVPEGIKAGMRGMRAECLGMPAVRKKNRSVGVLVGTRVELRIEARDESLQADEKLDALVGDFDLDALKAL